MKTLSIIMFGVLAACSTEGPVMIFGDSIANQLAQHVGGQVINAGVPSERLSMKLVDTSMNAPAGEQRVAAAVAGHKPHTMLIIEGTNDVLEGVYRDRDGRQWLDDAEEALTSMVLQAKQGGVRRVVVATVPPQRAGGRRKRDTYAALIPLLNIRIRAVARLLDVEVLDVHGIVSSDMDTFLSADDVHLTEAGNVAVWRAFAGR